MDDENIRDEEISIEKRLEGYKPDFSINPETIEQYVAYAVFSVLGVTGFYFGWILTLLGYLFFYGIGLFIGSKIQKFESNPWLMHIFGLLFVILCQHILTLFVRGGGHIFDLILISGVMAWFVIKPGLISLIGSLLYLLINMGLPIMLVGIENLGIVSFIPAIILLFVITYVLIKKLYINEIPRANDSTA